jgi:apolipoprotein N-acyltransferase
VLVSTAAAGVVAGAYLLDRDWTMPAGDPLSVALLQGNIAQDQKWDPAYRAMTLERYRALTEQHKNADIVVWPEAAIPLWFDQAQDYLADLGAAAGASGMSLVLGVPVRGDDGRAYNAVVSLGEPPHFYYKRRLVPFGEYVPLRGLLGPALDILGAPMSGFSAGTEARLLRAAGLPVGAFICYEAAYAAVVADLLPEARLLINVSNDAWFGESIGPLQHLQIARMRAIETQRALLRATNTGVTAVINADGEVVARAPQFEVAALTAQVTPRQGATPYVDWRDVPAVGLAAGVLLVLALLRVLGRHGRRSIARWRR